MLDKFIISMIILLFSIIVIFSFCSVIWVHHRENRIDYLGVTSTNKFKEYMIMFATYLIEYSHLINASMYIFG